MYLLHIPDWDSCEHLGLLPDTEWAAEFIRDIESVTNSLYGDTDAPVVERLEVLTEPPRIYRQPWRRVVFRCYWNGGINRDVNVIIDVPSLTAPTPKPALAWHIWPFEEDYTMGAHLSVVGTDLDAVQKTRDEIVAQILADPAQATRDAWKDREPPLWAFKREEQKGFSLT